MVVGCGWLCWTLLVVVVVWWCGSGLVVMGGLVVGFGGGGCDLVVIRLWIDGCVYACTCGCACACACLCPCACGCACGCHCSDCSGGSCRHPDPSAQHCGLILAHHKPRLKAELTASSLRNSARFPEGCDCDFDSAPRKRIWKRWGDPGRKRPIGMPSPGSSQRQCSLTQGKIRKLISGDVLVGETGGAECRRGAVPGLFQNGALCRTRIFMHVAA